jgi:hypothetical protein
MTMDAYTNFIKHESTKRISIARGHVVPVPDGRGTRLRVDSGSAWITQHKSTEDVFVSAGESFRIARNGLTLVFAISPSPFTEVTIMPPARTLSKFFRRFAARFARAD